MKIKVYIFWRDWRIGVYWNRSAGIVIINPLPMVGIILEYR